MTKTFNRIETGGKNWSRSKGWENQNSAINKTLRKLEPSSFEKINLDVELNNIWTTRT
jgi:hypothetical protein